LARGIIPKPHINLLGSLCHNLFFFLTKKNVRATFKPINMIRKSVNFIKDTIDPWIGEGVYKILFSCGKDYIGKGGRSIKIEVKEHVADMNIIKFIPQPWLITQTRPNIIFALSILKFWPIWITAPKGKLEKPSRSKRILAT
jgi:hypothetical protein